MFENFCGFQPSHKRLKNVLLSSGCAFTAFLTLPNVLLTTPARASNLSNSSTTVNLNGAGSNPFNISSSVTIDAIDTPAFHNAIFGDSTQAWTLTNGGNVLSEGADGVILQSANGTLTNLGSGLVYGAATGAELGTGGTVINNGLIESSEFEGGIYGILLDGTGKVVNNAGGTVAGYNAGINALGVASVSNGGLITDFEAGSGAVNLTQGGTVTNTTNAIVTGITDGIDVSGTSGFVSNAGTVTAGDYGIHLSGTGTVVNSGFVKSTYEIGITLGTAGDYFSNSSTGTIIGDSTGVMIGGYAASSVNNAGTIFSSFGQGVYLNGGGSVTNASTGVIDGYSQGVRIRYAAGTVQNFGSIVATSTVAESNPIGVYLKNGGMVLNEAGGYVAGYLGGVRIEGAGSVDNTGTIISSGGPGAGMTAGNLSNEVGGHIFGTVGVSISGTGGVQNAGYIGGTVVGVGLYSGTITNAATGTIDGGFAAIYTGATGSSLNNAGTVVGVAVGGIIMRGAGEVSNQSTGYIYGGRFAIALGVPGGTTTLSGIVENSGIIHGSYSGIAQYAPGSFALSNAVGGTISGGVNAVVAYEAAGSVTNAGMISATNFGVFIAGGQITNTAGATISAGNGIILNGTGDVSNAGNIMGTGTGVYVATGNVTNAATGTIAGGQLGVSLYHNTGTLTNAGLVTASSGVGFYGKYGGTAINQSGGRIISSGTALKIGYNANTGTNIGIVTNDGTIIAGANGQGIAFYGLGGGTVINAVGATISAGRFGILAPIGTSSVDNSGLIVGTMNVSVLVNDGQVSNNAGATIGGDYGVVIFGTGNIINAGLVSVTGNGAYVDVGNISNASTGTITGGHYGVYLYNASDSLSNAGIINGGTLGADLRYGGTVLNQSGGQIGGAAGIEVGYQGNTQSNAGTITNGGTLTGGIAGLGVELDGAGGGVVTNQENASISGGMGGVLIASGTDYVGNAGIINSGAGTGVQISAGSISNASTGTISGAAGGVYIGNTLANVTNAGVIQSGGTTGLGADLHLGGSLNNTGTVYGSAAGVKIGYQGNTLSNAALITNSGALTGGSAGLGIDLEGLGDSAITNFDGGSITGGLGAVQILYGPGVVDNAGVIASATADAVQMAGGTITNFQSGVITGGDTGIAAGDQPVAITNSGTILGGADGVVMNDGTLLNNFGALIKGGDTGLFVSGDAIIDNAGVISDNRSAGVVLAGDATLTNTGTISGVTGLVLSGDSAAVINSGVITSTVAGGNAILVEAPDPAQITLTSGSVLTGNIDGGGTDGQIVLQGTNQLGSNIVSFGTGSTLEVAPGANWIATGNWTVANVTNDGTFQAGVLGTPLSLTGNFTQSPDAVLQVVVTPTLSSQFLITGNASLAGTLKYVFAPGTYTAHTYQFLTASGAVSGSFSGVTYGGAVPDALSHATNALPADANLVLAGAAVQVTGQVVTIAPAVGATAVVAPADDALFSAAAQALAETAQQDNGLLLDKAAQGADAGSAACAAAANVSPETTSTNGTSTAGRFASIAAQAFCGAGGWVSATGDISNAGPAGAGTAPHYTTDVAGFMTGIDHAINNAGTRLGFAVGFDQLNLHDDDAGKASSDITRLGLYASQPLGRFTLAAEMSYGFTSNSTSRPTGVGTLRETNNADIVSGGLQAGTEIALGAFQLSPAAGVRFASVSGGHIGETGAGVLSAFAVTGSAAHYTSVQPYLSLHVSRDFITGSGITVAPAASLGYEIEAADRGVAANVLAPDGTAFSSSHVDLASNDALLGAGISAGKGMWSVYANYTAHVAGNWNAQTGEIGVAAKF